MQQTQAMVPNLGMEQVFFACGRQWRLARRELEVLERFLQWVIPQVPDPFSGLDKIIDKVPPEMANQLISEAKAKRETLHDWDGDVVKSFLNTKRGQLHLFMFMLQVYQPDATLDDAKQIGLELGEEKLASLFELANGQPPTPKNAQAPAA